jgi:large subunit ribosomal protein L9
VDRFQKNSLQEGGVKEEKLMKVILTQDMDSLGLAGEIVDVARGYARNYLIPKKIALDATEDNIKRTETQRKTIEVKRVKLKEDAQKIKERLAEVMISIAQKVGEEDKLYGSVTSMHIADELEKQGITIDRRKIMMDKPIKSLGEFSVPIKLHPQVTASIKVTVVPEP